jgi:threonine dehydrogenase-like Zn-dependent dehydrogenase
MRKQSATACWLVEPGLVELRHEDLAAPQSGQVQVRTLHSAISRGTETLVFRGVFCLHPHQSRFVVPVDAVYPLPDGVPPGRAVLAAQLETAVNALWDAAPRIGDRLVVVGAGSVGLLVAWLATRLPGCTVQVVDTQPARRALAEHLGASFSAPDAALDNADLVVHASGQPAGLATALRLAGFEATVLELSWYGTRSVNLPLGEAFHALRLTLKSSQVGQVAAAQRSRWTRRRRLELALSLLREPALDTLITDTAALSELPVVLARLAASSGDATLCQRIDYPA